VFHSKVGNDVYYFTPDERQVSNVSVENDQEDIKVILAKAYRSTVSWDERLGHLHGNAMRKIPVRSVKENSKKHGNCKEST
jgi:hypothetical protein